MLKKITLDRSTFIRGLTLSGIFIFTIIIFSVTTGVFNTRLAAAATNSTINFQARLLTNSGGIVPDGNYNVEFKLYNASTSSGSVQGSCTGDTACLWVETRVGANKVRVADGYLSVSLGSVTAFGGSINWNQQLWLTMNIGGTGSPSWDGEMNPRIQLTAVPYALTAGQLETYNSVSGYSSILQFTPPTASDTITLPDTTGTVCLDSSSACGFATGSGNAFLQGGNSFGTTALLGTGDNNPLNIETNGHVVQTLSITGQAVFENSANSTSAFTVENSSGKAELTVDSNNNLVALGSPSQVTGSLVFDNSSNTNNVTITSGTTGSSYILTLPTKAPSGGLCLQTSTASSSQLVFVSCANSNASITEVAEWDNNGSGITSLSDSPVNIGDIILLTTQITATNSIVNSVTGGGVSSWNKVVTNAGNGTAHRVEMWMGVVSTTGSGSISVNYSNSTGTNEITATELTAAGVSPNTVWGIDTSGAQLNSSATSTITYPNLTSELSPELYFGYAQSQNGGSAGSYSNFNYIITGENNVITYNLSTSAATAYQPTANQTSGESNTVGAIITAFVSSTAINNSVSLQQANFNVQAASSGSVAGVLQANASGAGDILDLLNGSGTKVATIGSTGNVLLQASTNSSTAFQVQNASSNPQLLINNSATSNLIMYPSFTSGSFTSASTGWAAVSPGTITQNTTAADSYDGVDSLKLTTTSSNGGADTTDFTSTLTSTTYYVSFYVMPSVAMNANAFTITLYNGTTDYTCTPSSQTLSLTGFTRVSCSIAYTSGASSTLTIAQTDSTARTIYISDVQLQTTGVTNYQLGTLQLPGTTLTSPAIFQNATNSTTAFQVQNAAGSNILSVNTTAGNVVLGTPNGSSNPISGALVLDNSTTAYGVTITTGATTASYNLALPITAPSSTGLCLQDSTSGTNTQLSFASCSTVNTSITEVYENDAHSTSNSSNPTTVSNTPQNVGDVLVLMAEESGTSTITGVSGGDVTTWTKVNVSPTNSTALRTEMWMGVITSTSGTPSVSVTYNTTPTSYEDAVMEFTAANVNSNSTWGVDSTGVLLNSTASTTITYPTLTSEGASEAYVGYAQAAGGSGAAGSYGSFSYKVTGGSNVITYVSPTVANTIYTPTASQSSGESNTVAAILVAFVNSTSINNNTLTQMGNFNVQAASAGSVAGVLQANSAGSGDILDLRNGSGAKVATIGSTGNALFEASTASTTAFQIQNSSGVDVLAVDTTNMRIGVDNSFTSMTAPSTPTVGNPTTGGSLPYPDNYYYKITAIDSMGGETTPSTQNWNTTQTSSPNKTILVSWAAVTGASGYKIYRSTTSGSEVYLTTVQGTSFTDAGQFTPTSATPPTTNTAYTTSTNSNGYGQMTVGGNGTPSGQLYVSGNVPTTSLGATGLNITWPASVYVQGHYAYIASYGNNELVIDDVTDPANPTFIGDSSTGLNDPTAVYVQGRYAYVASSGSSSNSLVIFDVSNPASPTEVGSVNTNLNTPGSVYVSGRYAYVTSPGNNELVIFDVSNPTNPTYVGETGSTYLSGPNYVFVQGRYAYVTNGTGTTMVIYDISNPASPAYVSATTDANINEPTSVFVQGRYAYVTNDIGGALAIEDISNPYSPAAVGVTGTNLNGPNSVYVQGNYAYVTNSWGSNGLAIVNISNPASPTYVGELDTNLSSPDSVFVSGRYAYVASYGNNELVTFDLGGAYIQQLQVGGTETGTLQVDGNTSIGGDTAVAGGLTVGGSEEVSGNLGVNGTISINTIDVGTNGTPTSQLYVSGTVPTTSLGTTSTNLSYPLDVFVSGKYAYITNYGSPELVIDDVSNPANPVYVSEISTNLQTPVASVYVSGRYAYVTSYGNNQLVIFDVSDPYNPVYVGKAGSAYLNGPDSVYVAGRYAYVASSNNNEMVIFDVSNPAAPVYVGETGSTYLTGPDYVFVQGRYAYVASNTTGSNNAMVIFDVSNPASPTYVGKATGTPINNPDALFISGNYAYIVSSTNNELAIYNISNPVSPTYVGETISSYLNNPSSVYVQGRYAYVTSSWGQQMVIFDVSNPASPNYVGEVGTNLANPISVFVSGRYAYVASYGNNELVTFDLGGAYIQQLQVGGIETSTLQVDGDSTLNGDAYLTGGLTVGGSADIAGNTALGGLTINDGLATPGAPTLTVTTAGTTSYGYAITATNSSGSSAVSANTTTSLAAATLNSTTNYIRASWSGVTGASSYNVYRTSGGAAQGLIGTVSNTNTLTPTGFSMTGTVLTLTFSSAPPWAVGQAITLAGFTSSPTSVNGTWPITGLTATTATINITSGATSTESVMGTAQGTLGFFDMAQTAGIAAPTTATAGTLLLQTTSTTAFQVQNAAGSNILSVNTTAGNVVLGTPNGSSNPISGALVLDNSTTAYGVTITTGATTASYNLALPITAPSSTGLCLQDSTSGTNTQLSFASCSTVNTSITEVYENDAHSTSNSSNPTTVSNTPQNVGDVLVLMAEESGTSTITGVSGGDVTTWTKVNVSPTNSTALRTEMWMGVITSTSGTPSVSVTYNTTPTSYEDAVMEFTAANVNSNSTWGVDSTGVLLNSTASTTITYPTLTSEGASEAYVGYAQATGGSGAAGSYGSFSYKVTGGSNVITYVSPTVANTIYTPTASQSSGESNTVAAILVAFVNSTSINNNTLTQMGNFNVQAASAGSVAGVLQANSAGSGDILDLRNGVGTNVATIGSTGNALFEASTNSASAFQIQNAGGNAQLIINNAATNNLVQYPSFASGSFTSASTGWIAVSPGTIVQNTTAADSYDGVDSLDLTTTTSNGGAQTTAFTSALTSTTYYASFYVMPGTAMNASAFTITLYNGTTSYTCSPASQTLSTTSFTRVSCSIAYTSGSSSTLTIAQNDSTARTNIYISDVQLQITGVTNYQLGTLQLPGTTLTSPAIFQNSANSTTALQVQNTSGTSLLTVDTTNSRVDIGTNGTPSGQLYISGSIPVYVGSNSDSNLSNPHSVYVAGNYAYVASYTNNKLVVYNISSGTPVYVGSNSDSNLSYPYSVYVAGNYAYVVNNGSPYKLVVYNISSGTPVYVGQNSDSNLSYPYSVYVAGNYAYVDSEGNNKLVVYNISSGTPVYVGQNSDSNLSNPASVYVAGNYAYVVNNGSPYKLVVYNISSGTPVYVGSNSDSNLSHPYSVYVAGNYAYVASAGNNKLVVYNISSGTPVYVGSNSDSNLSYPYSVYVAGNYAYVASEANNKLVVYNISSGTPVYVGQNSDSNLSYPYSVYVAGNYAYVASYTNNKLVVYNIGGTYSQSLQAGSTVVSTLQVAGDSVLSGDASIQGGLTVGTNAEINNNLGVGGSVLFQNATNSTTAFQVQNAAGTSILIVNTTGGILTVNGHIVTGNISGTTTATVQTAAGTGASCSLSGDDTAGQITLTTGTASWATGAQCIVTFANSYGSAPHPVITPASSINTSAVIPYVTSSTATLTINFIAADTAQHTYTWNYFNSQ